MDNLLKDVIKIILAKKITDEIPEKEERERVLAEVLTKVLLPPEE